MGFKSRTLTGSRVAIYVFLLIITVVFLFPFPMMIKKSLEDKGFDNYVEVFRISKLERNLLSSVCISMSTVALVAIMSLPAAFAFSKLHLRGNRILYYFILSALMIPPAVSLVPLLVVMKRIRLLDNYLSVIFPFTSMFIPFSVLIVRNFMDDLPNELLEAAYIDGARTFQIFREIVLPLAKSPVLVIVLFTFISSWNELLYPLVFLRDTGLQTLTVVPLRFIGSYMGNIPQIFAAGNLIVLPTIVLFLFLQRFFEAGIVAGSLKG